MRSMILMMVAVVLGGLLFAGIAVAEDADFYFQDESGPVFYITLPDTWTGEWQEIEGVTVLHAVQNDGNAYLSVVAAHDADPENVGEITDAILAELVTDQNFEKWDEGTINDIPVYSSASLAKTTANGTEVNVNVAYFIPQEDAAYILYIISPPQIDKALEDQITAILGSLRTEE
jgi:hypothetical protein